MLEVIDSSLESEQTRNRLRKDNTKRVIQSSPIIMKLVIMITIIGVLYHK